MKARWIIKNSAKYSQNSLTVPFFCLSTSKSFIKEVKKSSFKSSGKYSSPKNKQKSEFFTFEYDISQLIYFKQQSNHLFELIQSLQNFKTQILINTQSLSLINTKNMTSKMVSDIVFNNSVIPCSQIFLMRKNVFGLINNRPFVKGHVLICSRRIVSKLQNLTQIQTLDLFMTAQQVAKKLQTIYNAQYEMTVQNGKDAGQTVMHVHIHLCPKHPEHALERKNQQARTEDEMAKQAEKYRGLFEQSSE